MKKFILLLFLSIVFFKAEPVLADNWEYSIILNSCYNKTDDAFLIPETINGITVTAIGDRCFAELDTIDNVALPETIDTIGAYAFTLSSLSSIKFDNQAYKVIGTGAFSCTDLESIVLPRYVDFFGDEVFRNCDMLKAVTLPEDLISIPSYTFFECTSLTSIKIPMAVTVIEDNAFWSCESLVEIELPNDLVCIKENAFEGCSGIETISLPVGTRIIYDGAFMDCENLKYCICPETVEYIAADAFDGCPSICLKVKKDSYAERFAILNGINYEVIH